MFRLSCCCLLMLMTYPSIGQEVDPTRPLTANGSSSVNQAKKTLQLESILTQKEQRIAIINGQLVKVADRIGEYHVKAIGKNKVILATAEKQIELSLFTQIVASPQ